MALTLDKLKFGELNNVKENDDSHTGDRRLTSPLTALRFAAEKAFSKDTLLGISEFFGIVVGKRTISYASPEYPGQMIAQTQTSSSAGDSELYLVYIPEIEPLPAPKSYCDPVLLAYKEIPTDSLQRGIELATGDIVKVKYDDVSNLSGPRITEFVTAAPNNMWEDTSITNTSRTRRNSGRTTTGTVATTTAPPAETPPSTAEAEEPVTPTFTTNYIVVPTPDDQQALLALAPDHYGFPIEGLSEFLVQEQYPGGYGWDGLEYYFEFPWENEYPDTTPILAIADGKIMHWGVAAGHSAYIVIEHDDVIYGGKMYVSYDYLDHLEAVPQPRSSTNVVKGEIVATAPDALSFSIYKRFGGVAGVLSRQLSPIAYYPEGTFVGNTATTAGKAYIFEDMVEIFEAGSP